jgi:hypothetical protein
MTLALQSTPFEGVIVGALLSAFAAAILATLSGRRASSEAEKQRQHASEEAEKQRLHDRREAAERRLWDRRAKVYVDALGVLQLTATVIEQTHPKIQMGDPPPPPDPIDEAELRTINAALGAFGSSEVQAIVRDEWQPSVMKFWATVGYLDEMKRDPTVGRDIEQARQNWGTTVSEQLEKVYVQRENVEAAFNKFHGVVTAELQSGGDAWRDTSVNT